MIFVTYLSKVPSNVPLYLESSVAERDFGKLIRHNNQTETHLPAVRIESLYLSHPPAIW